MHLFTSFSALTALAVVAAAPQSVQVQSTRCYTVKGSTQPLSVPTRSQTSNLPCTSTTTVSLTVTTTPAPSTSVVSTTITTTFTAPTTTYTATSTTTATTTSSITSTSTEVDVVSTTTSIVSTSTVPAPANFTPVQSSLPNSTYLGSGGFALAKRDLEERQVDLLGLDGLLNTFAQQVDCIAYSLGVCATATVTSTSTVTAATPTVTTTTTQTQTNTVYPSATETSTVSTTVTTSAYFSTTVTTTTTTTITSVTSTPTFYAACANANMADQINGLNITGLHGLKTPEANVETKGTTAYDCCVAGLQSSYPGLQAYWFLVPTTPSQSAWCNIYYNASTCVTQSDYPYKAYPRKSAARTVVGNFQCGEFNSVYSQ
ncbi:hypothetical protein AMS68_006881 [Peltaster fructicola]|uniref:Ig-like domain-containing protein n=1 Tax=Peltaster fructicola TaxID=286661 RepID=A0A6H0Y2X5_9PEZI|nr:hypothetical protein AMS68_006881 [Peltaster fructicola]